MVNFNTQTPSINLGFILWLCSNYRMMGLHEWCLLRFYFLYLSSVLPVSKPDPWLDNIKSCGILICNTACTKTTDMTRYDIKYHNDIGVLNMAKSSHYGDLMIRWSSIIRSWLRSVTNMSLIFFTLKNADFGEGVGHDISLGGAICFLERLLITKTIAQARQLIYVKRVLFHYNTISCHVQTRVQCSPLVQHLCWGFSWPLFCGREMWLLCDDMQLPFPVTEDLA